MLKTQDQELTLDHLKIWKQSVFEEAQEPEPELEEGHDVFKVD